MKKLSEVKIESLTDEKAWEVVKSFTDFQQKGNQKIPEFEEELEYERTYILLCLLRLLKNNLNNKEYIENICAEIMILFTGFIPNPDSYKKLIELKKITDKY